MTPAELITRLESAPEGGRDLDALVYCAVHTNHKPCGGKGGVTLSTPEMKMRGWFYAPHYTTNLQDALGLVPEGHTWGVGYDDEDKCCVSLVGKPGSVPPDVKSSTPALALTIACLKAREEMKG